MDFKNRKGLKTSYELFTLIKSLTPEEKGYFKKMSSFDARSEKYGLKYVLLYDAIDQAENVQTFLSKEFEQNLIREKIVKNYADEKSHLQDLILKALRTFHSNRQVDMKLSDALKDIFILKERKLPNLHLKAIIKAKEIATKYERYLRLIEVIHEELFYYVSNLPAEKIEEKYNNLQADLRATMEIHHLCVNLKSIKTFLFKQVMSGKIIHDIDQITAEVEGFRKKVEANPYSPFTSPSIFILAIFSLNITTNNFPRAWNIAKSSSNSIMNFRSLRKNTNSFSKQIFAIIYK
ncbi:MAG: hypothetical protein IPK03_14900 [Bacteroidetes bacterium]|nr:hypothetical protein [Bacteroidota bacterium]